MPLSHSPRRMLILTLMLCSCFAALSGYISFAGDQAADGRTSIIPLHGSKPDDAIFVYPLSTIVYMAQIHRCFTYIVRLQVLD